MYGGDSNQGLIFVPNYSGIFLRGAGNQTLDLQIPSYPKNYVTSINQSVKSFLERANNNVIGISFTSSTAVSSLNYTTASNNGVVESFPVHTSIQYFIKY